MILWFLRLFSYVLELELDNNRLRVQRDNAQDGMTELNTLAESLRRRLEDCESDRQHLWTLVSDALSSERTAFANERAAYQMHVNHAVQRQGGGIPYPGAHSLPPNVLTNLDAETGAAGRKGREIPSIAVRQRFDQLVHNAVEAKKAAMASKS